jgi:histidinol phosphatase-like enzyme
MQKLESEGYQIVVFTNQAGVANGRTKVSDLEYKFSEI